MMKVRAETQNKPRNTPVGAKTIHVQREGAWPSRAVDGESAPGPEAEGIKGRHTRGPVWICGAPSPWRPRELQVMWGLGLENTPVRFRAACEPFAAAAALSRRIYPRHPHVGKTAAQDSRVETARRWTCSLSRAPLGNPSRPPHRTRTPAGPQ